VRRTRALTYRSRGLRADPCALLRAHRRARTKARHPKQGSAPPVSNRRATRGPMRGVVTRPKSKPAPWGRYVRGCGARSRGAGCRELGTGATKMAARLKNTIGRSCAESSGNRLRMTIVGCYHPQHRSAVRVGRRRSAPRLQLLLRCISMPKDATEDRHRRPLPEGIKR
jgi:hypothetical protein